MSKKINYGQFPQLTTIELLSISALNTETSSFLQNNIAFLCTSLHMYYGKNVCKSILVINLAFYGITHGMELFAFSRHVKLL